MKKKLFLIAVPLMAILFFMSQQSTANNVNGFFADPGSFEILSSYQGRNNVLKVDSSKTNWYIASYSLARYRRKPITIEFSADVRREGSAGYLSWQVNNAPYYPGIASIENASPNVWHNISGKRIITPTDNNPILYLTNYGINSPTNIYIANPTVTITEGDPLTPDLSLTPLKKIYENHFLIGNITNDDGGLMYGKYLDIMKHHYNIVTCNVTYPVQLMPLTKGGAYRFTAANNTINIARRNKIPVHGHVLVWHEETLAWMFEGTREEVIQNMNNYITAVLRNFRGKINSWDVVNEAIKYSVTASDAQGDWRNCVRRSTPDMPNPWFDKLGADYIELAFRFARAADPNITLYYNDYDLENPNKAEAVRKMIQDINDRYKKETGGTRNLIEGVGSQAHHQDINLNLNDVRTSLERLISLGIEVAITELDVRVKNEYLKGVGMDSIMSERDAIAQAVFYARIMNLYKEYSAHITRVSFWGIDDNTSFISTSNPCLFDWKLNAKPAFHAVSDPDGFLRQNRR